VDEPKCIVGLDTQHLEIVEDLLDEGWMMKAVVGQGETLALVFGVG
jgi:hypothetical protein